MVKDKMISLTEQDKQKKKELQLKLNSKAQKKSLLQEGIQKRSLSESVSLSERSKMMGT